MEPHGDVWRDEQIRSRGSRSPIYAVLASFLFLALHPAEAATHFALELDATLLGELSESTGSATGSATLTQDAAGYHLRYEVFFDETFDFTGFGGGGARGVEVVIGMHFHDEDEFGNLPVGGQVMGLISPANDLDGDLSFTPSGTGTLMMGEWDSGEGRLDFDLDDFVPALLAASSGEVTPLFLVLHTSLFPGASIAGRVVAQAAPVPALRPGGRWSLIGALLLGASAAIRSAKDLGRAARPRERRARRRAPGPPAAPGPTGTRRRGRAPAARCR